MDRNLKFGLIGLLAFTGLARADQTIFQPTVFSTGSSLTINSGVTVDFAAGSIVDFTGATVTGLAGGGGGSGTVTSITATTPIIVTPSPLVATGVVSLDSAKVTLWDTASADRLKWDGGATGLTAATGRTSLGLVIGTNVEAYLGNPSTNGYVLSSTTAGVRSWIAPAVGGSGAPTTADYLVGTADGGLSAEIVVGTAPGGELGGTWASPTIDDSLSVTSWTLVTPTIAAISNLTGNGFVKTSGGIGTLSIDTSTYLTAASISDTAFANTWDTVTTIAPSKNAVYDILHIADTDDDGKINVLDLTAGLVKTDGSGIVSTAVAGTDYQAAGALTTAGDLSPLFTTTETAGNVAFSLSTASANTVFGNATASTAAPTFSSSPRFTAIGNLTSNGFVKTSGGVGTLSVDTATYLTATSIDDTAFASTWNAVTTIAPSKNAVYDWAHLFDTDDDGLVNKLDMTDGIVQVVSNVVSPITVGSGLSFTAGTLSATAGGGGTVTDFSAGDLSPLFTTTEATTTTTPALSFGLTSAAATTVFGRAAGTSGAPTYSSAPQFLKIGNLTTNGFVKTGSSDGTLSVDTSTYLTANQSITLSGDVSGGPAATAITTVIGANKVTLAMMATMATDSILGRATASTGNVEVLTSLPFAWSGGDVARAADSNTETINTGAVTYAKMQNVSATSRFLGRITAAAGVVEELTAANAKTILALTSTDVGLGNVTNNAQTQSAIVPNTAPSAGQILAGNAGGTAYAPVTVSGSGATISLASTGVMTIGSIANASLDSDLAAIGNISGVRGDVIYYGASGWAKLAAGTAGNQLTTQGASADPTWSAAGSGGGGSPGGSDTQIQFNDSTAFNGDAALTFTKATGLTTFKNGLTIGAGPVSSDAWINMPTGGPSGIGDGGAGINPWIAYVFAAGQFGADAEAGDVIYRSHPGGKLLHNLGGGFSQLSITTAGPRTRSDLMYGFSSSTTLTSATATDTAIGRNAAGVVEVNNGTAGQYRDIKVDEVDAVTGYKLNGTTIALDYSNTSVTNQTPSTSDVYLVGSSIVVPAGGFKASGQYRCLFDVVKSAGTGGIVLTVRIGTTGTVASDTSRMTFTFPAGTSVADTGTMEVIINWRTVGSGTSAVISGLCRAQKNTITAAGLWNDTSAAKTIVGTVSSGFASDTATTMGVSFNGGTAFAGTITTVQSNLFQK